MFKKKLFILLTIVFSIFTLVSCGLSNEEANDVTSSDSSSNSSDKSTSKSKYEVGTASVDFWNTYFSSYMKISVPVKNVGETDLYLKDISIDIENENGNLLQTVSDVSAYPEYIKPGETAYYYEEESYDFTESNVKVVPHVKAEKMSKSIIRYAVTDVSISNDSYNGVKILGRVENTYSKSGIFDIVVVNLFDSNNKLICNAYTYLSDDLDPGDKVGFNATPFLYRKCTASDVSRYEIYAYPYQSNW